MTSEGERWFLEAAAHLRRGERAATLRCLRSCIATGDPRWAAQAGANLGGLLWQLGDLHAARRVSAAAVALEHPEWSGLAGVTLGLIETQLGDRAAAAATYRAVAATSGSDEAVANALFNLATMHQDVGEVAEAVGLYREVAAGPHAGLAAEAGANLGHLLHTARPAS